MAEEKMSLPWYSPARLLQRALAYLAVAYMALCSYLYFAQNSIEYPRHSTGADLPASEALERARASGLIAWEGRGNGFQGYVPLDFNQSHARGTIVVFHGNGAWAGQRTCYVEAFSRRGFRTFLYEYPGYGGRPGQPRESVIVPDAAEVVAELAHDGYGPLYLWGESLGSGVAAAVSRDPDLPIHGLVLVTPWDTVANVGRYRYPLIPVGWLMTDRYDSLSNLQNFGHPVCVVRCSQDEIIPPALTLRLFSSLPEPKKLILQAGYGHDDWPTDPSLTWWDEALNFIAQRP
jgi:pimeloyl-ACP methyl ester carboxylesterase